MAVKFWRNSNNEVFKLMNCGCQVVSNAEEKMSVQLHEGKFSFVLINGSISKISLPRYYSKVKF